MNYRNDKQKSPISLLGYGCMRFSRKGSGIDLEKAEKEILRAIDLGINYYDTAYIYPGSEVALGEILHRNQVREKVHIATKLPQYLIKSKAGIDKYFAEQCERLQTDYIDYYLMHMLTDIASWQKLVDLGIQEWIQEKKASGQIRQIGFSFHGNTDMFLEILHAYDWDFCQIQYNYLDEHTQAGRKGLEEAERLGIPVIIMEPLRGGKLVDLLPEKAKQMVAANERTYSAAEWAFRWLYDQNGVTCVLSGMNSIEMLEENVRVASSSEAGMLTKEDHAFIAHIRKCIEESMYVGCTGCRYCMPCPKGIDIPALFSCYNHMATEGKADGRHEYMQTLGLRKDGVSAEVCVNCGKCESHCPQAIPIRQEIQKAQKALTPWYYRIGLKVARWWLFGRRKAE